MVQFFDVAMHEPCDVGGPEKGIVKSTRVSHSFVPHPMTTLKVNVIGMRSRKQYYKILYSRFYKECIWREKNKQIRQLQGLQMVDKSTRRTHCFCKIIPGKLLNLQL